MDGFSRAYRDKHSPLAPLTPLSQNNIFSFRVGGDDSLKPWIEQVDAKRLKRAANNAPKPVAQHQAAAARQLVGPAAPKPKLQQAVKAKSKVAPRAQSTEKRANHAAAPARAHNKFLPPMYEGEPQLSALLARVGMLKYFELFEREAVDFGTFRKLKLNDLIRLGVTNYNDIRHLRRAIEMANEMR